LVAEGLSRAISEARRTKRIKDVRITRSKAPTNLLFVDDVLQFCFGSQREGQCLNNILQLYNKAPSMEIHNNKSAVYTVRLERIQDLGIGGLFPFQHLDMLEGIKCMGFTLKPNFYGKANSY
jgi:hypothetical protein